MGAESTNPYEAPSTDEASRESGVDWRRASQVFALWLIGASILAGLFATFRTGFALRVFDGHVLTSPIVTIEAFRGSGAHVAATAAALAAFTGVHENLSRKSGWACTRDCWPLFVAVPPAAAFAACLMAVCAIIVSTSVFDVAVVRSWNETWHRLSFAERAWRPETLSRARRRTS